MMIEHHNSHILMRKFALRIAGNTKRTTSDKRYSGCLGRKNALWGRLRALWGLGLGVARRCSACNDWHQGVHWV